MSEFIYLYRGGTRSESPAEGEVVMQKWLSWMQDLESKGHLKDRDSRSRARARSCAESSAP